MLPQQYCLRWRYHHSNLQTMFGQLLEREAFCDVTLACEGRTIRAHKIVLSACSTYFDTILSQYEEKDPILIMKDVKYADIKCLVEFMYKGEINVDHYHLATLLKTAEELKIKGLAEVSWRGEEESNNGSDSVGVNGVHSALPHVSTVMKSPKRDQQQQQQQSSVNNKRKRGRPPIDDYDPNFPAPKVSVAGGGNNNDDGYSNDGMSNSDHDVGWDDDHNVTSNDQINDQKEFNDEQQQNVQVKSEHFLFQTEDESMTEEEMVGGGTTSTPNNNNNNNNNNGRSGGGKNSTSGGSGSGGTSVGILTSAIEKEWPDVIKMNDYLSTGRRQQFWEEPFTKRVMDAIKNKNLEMKIAAELLGVSYGTLYGRYRDAYGCLKHPYRIRDFWSEQGPTDILLKLKRKEITLYRAAEQLNVTPQTLSNYLISMAQVESGESMSVVGGGNAGSSNTGGESYEENDSDEEEEEQKHQVPPPTMVYTNSSTSGAAATAATTLPNMPDVTIIKRDKINNNSDHHHSTLSATTTTTTTSSTTTSSLSTPNNSNLNFSYKNVGGGELK